eukprot:TRINITY_DN28139_c0_g1_i1.p1 TRINITY_DN28139_c0_g1~~TRINITY_DN28139_c0_g1_i1.p1  ORF type:complete len:252 (+),score=70.17 TRINITY_DN28139_c0_g1_i1:98-757(+)
MSLLERLAAAQQSPPRKKAAGDESSVSSASQQQQQQQQQQHSGKIVELSNAELTRGFLAHDNMLRELEACTTAAWKLGADCALGNTLLSAVQVWKADLKPGKPHPFGACSTVVATCLLQEISEKIGKAGTQAGPKDLELKECIQKLLSQESAAVAREFSHCSARKTKKGDDIILEMRLHAHSFLRNYVFIIDAFVEAAPAERLGKKPAQGLARKANGKK